jgi:hypothetical protein
MRYAYYLEKSLLQMILQTYLNYCTHLKATTKKLLQSWRAGSSYVLFSLQVFSTVCSSSDLVGVFLLYVFEGVVTS